jgi:signal transduction histidine kinase/CheY-like chemotaxis protein
MGVPKAYHQVAVTRVRELGLRLGFAVLIAFAAAYASSPLLPAAWLAAVVASQVLNAALGLGAARDPGFAPTRAWEGGYLVSQAVNSVVFASIGPFLWFQCGAEGPLLALVVLMGGLLNIGTQPATTGRLLWCGVAPYALTLGALPIVTLLRDPHASAVEMGFLDVGAGLYLLHVLRAVRRRDEAARETAEALQHAEQASAAKSTFLATMSHEIRTPLNGVLGMAQAMERDRLSATQRKRLGVIRQSGSVLLTLLNDLLDISKVESGRLELEDGLLDLQEMADQARDAFAALAANKGVGLAVEVSPDAAGVWRTDPTRVRQILYNLLSNAVKFTERGSVTATLDLDAEGRLRIQVRDTGVGIPAADLPSLFGRFVQGDASVTRRFGGSGLGLAISRELARLMGGDLTAESTAGVGSTFTAVLPLTRGVRPQAREDERHEPIDVSGLRAVVAEDNETNRLVIATILDQLGMVARLAVDGSEALEAWRTEAWDLVLMDIQMPVMDGVEATRRIREIERDERRPHTPIVALTANAMSHHLAEYAAAGFDAVATKPIQIAALLAAIQTAMAAGGEPAEARRRRA